MNPRVSRSSALASKATGYPIAKVAAKLAVGYTLDEIPNDLTGTTPASFEPTLDYVVVKFPRFAFEKFPGADETLGTQMKSVGEAMGIGRTFTEAFLKAMRSRELDAGAATPWATLDALPDGVHPWFLAELERAKSALCSARAKSDLVANDWIALKSAGWSDREIGIACNTSEEDIRAARVGWGVRPAYRRVDSCAAEVEARSNYLYSTWGEEDEARPAGKSVVILGSGPNRIGQGIEFDYCCVHAAKTFRSLGYEAVMVNCNPETVSTDYDTSDRLYFEPLGEEEVLEICARERPLGVVIQFGGQTPLKLARALEDAGYAILGTPFGAVDLAEDRERFAALCGELGIVVPPWGAAAGQADAIEIAEKIGYPVLVRPSYVLGGRNMRVCYGPEEVGAAAANAGRVLVDRFLEGAVEIDVDALCDGAQTLVAAVMEHVEEAGVHSGDSSCVLPPPSLTPAALELVEATVRKLAPALGVVGLVNVQLAVAGDELYVLEANPRASRTVPFASKAIGVNLVDAACRLAAGARLGRAGARARRRERPRLGQGGRLPVRPLPGRRPRARAGDALHRRGDGERRGLLLGDREGRARGGQAASGRRNGVPLCPRFRQGGGRGAGLEARRCRLRALRDSGNRARACGGGPAGHERAQGGGGRGQRDRRRPRPPPSLRPRRQHTCRPGRALGRLPHPRGRARRPRSLHHDPRRGVRGRRGDRPRAKRGCPVPPGASCEENCLTSSGSKTSAPTGSSASSGGASSPAVPGQFFMLAPPGRLLPRPMSLSLATRTELGFLIDPVGPGTKALTGVVRGERAQRARAARKRISPRRRKSVARGRRDRCRAVSLPLRAARTATGRARLPFGGARRGGGARARTPRWSSSRAS